MDTFHAYCAGWTAGYTRALGGAADLPDDARAQYIKGQRDGLCDKRLALELGRKHVAQRAVARGTEAGEAFVRESSPSQVTAGLAASHTTPPSVAIIDSLGYGDAACLFGCDMPELFPWACECYDRAWRFAVGSSAK